MTLALLAALLLQSPDEKAVRDYMAGLARQVTERSLAGVETRADWEGRRDGLRTKLLSALGLDPLPERTPLKAVVTGTHETDAFRVESLMFQALPGFYCTANLYVPKDGRAKHPGILYVCGHSNDPMGAKVKYQHHPVALASRGYVVLIVDPIQISEIEAVHHGTHRYGLWHWQALGYTPMGLEVWCGMRSLDYLASRPEVDPDKLAMTGRSGGGTMTWFTMALDPRVKAGVTANATGLVGTHVAHDTLKGHCDCAFYVNHPRIDYSDVAALCSPRPVLIQSGQKDWIYPPEGYRPLEDKVRKVYALYGAQDKFRQQDVDAEHKDLPEFRSEAFRWFELHLRGRESKEEIGDVEKIDPALLRAVRGPLPPDVRNASIAEDFAPPFVSAPTADRSAWEARQAEVRRKLAALTFANEPAVGPRGEDGMPAAIERLGRPDGPRVLVAVGDVDVKPALARMPVLRVRPRGGWDETLGKFVRRAAPLVGRSLGTMQTTDVLAAVAAAGEKRVVLYGKGEGAMLALAASLRAPVERVILEDLPDSLLAEPILLNAARVTDVPELLSIATPSGLVFMGRPPLGYARARDTAVLLGRPGLAVRAAALAEALDEIERENP